MDIKISSVKNIRDFSEYGYKYHIRSAHLNKLSKKDAALLTERCGLKTVIDLRTTAETAERPDANIPGVEYIHIPVFDNAVPGISHENETDKFKKYIPDMQKMYELLVTEEQYAAQLRRVMDIICDSSRKGAVLWHCTEGKDRCGIVSALFLLSRGVQPSAVIEDYLLTNRVNRARARKFYMLVLLMGRGREFASQVSSAFLAKREYIEPIMDRLTELAADFTISDK